MEALHSAKGDVFGRIYEYFLNEFALGDAQEDGAFFTPPSLVRMIVNVIEPNHGTILDPACGSGGMFVQTGHFLQQGSTELDSVTFYEQEKIDHYTKLARMNLAVHGLDGIIKQGNTYYTDLHEKLGDCDFVMANPPFNGDGVIASKIKNDTRLPFGLPSLAGKSKGGKGGNGSAKQAETISNANYLWIQHFHAYLNAKGRCGFVMAASASDAGGKEEKRIRQELLNSGHVDVMVSIGTNFFYTRSLPCSLWFFDKGKPKARQDQVLMLDARNIYRVVNRRVRDFTDEHLANLAAIVRLYRGETEKYLGLVGSYLSRTAAGMATIADPLAAFAAEAAATSTALSAFLSGCAAEEGSDITEEQIVALRGLADDLSASLATWQADRDAVLAQVQADAAWYAKNQAKLTTNKQQVAARERWDGLAQAIRTLGKDADRLHRQAAKIADGCRKEVKDTGDWDGPAIKRQITDLEQARDAVVDAYRAVTYPHHQAHWLQTRFPDTAITAVPGLCKVVSRAEIKAADGSFTPGRYVGVGAVEEEDEDSFQDRLLSISQELAVLDDESAALSGRVRMALEMTL